MAIANNNRTKEVPVIRIPARQDSLAPTHIAYVAEVLSRDASGNIKQIKLTPAP